MRSITIATIFFRASLTPHGTWRACVSSSASMGHLPQRSWMSTRARAAILASRSAFPSSQPRMPRSGPATAPWPRKRSPARTRARASRSSIGATAPRSSLRLRPLGRLLPVGAELEDLSQRRREVAAMADRAVVDEHGRRRLDVGHLADVLEQPVLLEPALHAEVVARREDDNPTATIAQR